MIENDSNTHKINTPDNDEETNTTKKISVSLSLGKKKKSKSLESSSASVGNTTKDTSKDVNHKKIAELFGSGEDENALSIAAAAQLETEKREKEGIKLVIPLSDSRDKNEPLLSGLKRIVSGHDTQQESTDPEVPIQDVDDIEQEAEAALIASASNHFNQQTLNADDGTNFSAFGSSLIIPKKENENDNVHSKTERLLNDDDIKYKRDLEHRAEDIGVDSESYVAVPISEFGAAMLRGMGWTGQDEKNKKSTENIAPRPHRLGLGATKLPSSMSDVAKGSQHSSTATGKRHYARKGGSIVDRAHLEKEEEEERKWKLLQEEKRKKDLQVTLQVGSIVKVRKEDGRVGKSRAKLVKVSGVPGLNQVLVRFEFDRHDTTVKKGDLVLVDRHELEESPFQIDSDSIDNKKLKGTERSHRNDRKEKSSSKRSRSRSRSFDRDSDKKYKDRKRKKHDDQKDRHLKEERKDHKYDAKKMVKEDNRSEQPWLIPNIRVRIISKKIASGKFFKEKGVVIDVLKKGTEAIIQLDNGQVIDRVPERYLETAIPKVGGNAIILIGRNRHEKGKLLERNSDKGRGSIQLFEEMNIVTLSLDDMAEWCGPLDDTVHDDF